MGLRSKLLILLALLLIITPLIFVLQNRSTKAASALSFICASSAAATSTAACSGEQAGDLLLVMAGATSGGAAPSLATGFNSITTLTNSAGSSTTQTGMRVGWANAASSSTGSGTWTSATDVVMMVYRGQNISPIGTNFGTESGSNSGTTVSFNADNLSVTDGSSWFAAFALRNTADAKMATAPTGMTNRTSVPATPAAAGHDLNGPTASNWSLQSVTGFSASAKYTSIVLEIKSAKAYPQLAQPGYTFENDDGANVNSDTVQAGSSFTSGTSITNVQKGERITLRLQLKNTGSGALDPSTLGLFYDRNDGIWTKVAQSTAPITGSGSGCTASSWTCGAIDTAHDVTGSTSSMAISKSGQPMVAFNDGSPNNLLRFARYVGGGGSGCGNSSAWDCKTIVSAQNQYINLSVTPSGTPWISYYLSSTGDMAVAQYVGTSGSGCATGVTDWTCTSIDTTNNTGEFNSLAIDSSGTPWISYYDVTALAIRLAHFVGSGGTGCAVTSWTCTTIMSTNVAADPTALAIDPSGNPWIAYQDTTGSNLMVAQPVATGGGCTNTAWDCVDVQTNSFYTTVSMAVGPTGQVAVAYSTSSNINYGLYAGSGGSGCTSTAWSCTSVSETSPSAVSLAYDTSGEYWISFSSSNKLYTYQVLGNSSTIIDSGTTVGTGYTSIAYDTNGHPWVSYYDDTNSQLKIATVSRAGEITMSSGVAGTNGASITSSHADMTSASDSTDAASANCLSGTWNNGKWFTSAEGNVSLPAGSSTAQCTEVAFIIDTSQAIAGDTYRFAVATKDSFTPGKGIWRGPITLSVSFTLTLPSLTISSSTTQRYTKDAMPEMSACTATGWSCAAIDSTNNVGTNNSLAFDPSGNPWVSYSDITNNDLRVARYVGSGGTGCATTSWTCTAVDTANTVGTYTSIAFDPSGNPWVSYWDGTNADLRVAQYLGGATTGTGCAVNTWTCTSVDTTNNVGAFTSIAFDQSGNPWISYYDTTNLALRVAQYVGSGGTGCAVTSWTCTSIDDTANDIGQYSSIAFGPSGNPWISYYDNTNGDLRVAQYLGGATTGTGCTANTWTCTAVDTANAVGKYDSIAFDPSGNPWISYYDSTNLALRVAKYLGGATTGTGCAVNTWTCTTVDTANNYGQYSAIAFDPSGNPWVSYYNATGANLDLRVAQYLGGATTGTGCAVNTWTCTAVDTTNDVGQYTSIAFDPSGNPWISYDDNTNQDLRVAKLNITPGPLTATDLYVSNGRNAPRSEGRWHLDNGYAPRASSGSCTATTNFYGYCGLSASDSVYDSVAALANQRPIYTFMTQNSNNTAQSTTWVGKSSVAASTKNLVLQVYHFGTTNAWETVTTNTTCAANTNCTISGSPVGTASEYYQADGSSYDTYWRLYQVENTAAETLSSDYFNISFSAPSGPTVNQCLRGCEWFNASGIKQPFNWAQ